MTADVGRLNRDSGKLSGSPRQSPCRSVGGMGNLNTMYDRHCDNMVKALRWDVAGTDDMRHGIVAQPASQLQP